MRVGFLTTHPIQYQVPVFRCLQQREDVDLTVLFCMIPDADQQGAGFGVQFEWDVPLLEGYRSRVLENVSQQPGVTHFGGCDTPGIEAVLREERFEALVVNGWVVKSCLQGLRACRQLGIPCIVRGEANNLRPRAWWKRIVQRQLVKRYDACLYIGEANREFYRGYGVSDDRLFPARYCIENDRFATGSAEPGAAERIRKLYGIADDAVCFLFSGKFEAKKHPVELVRAFQIVAEQSPKVHLLMVGDGELRAECESIATDADLPVTFAGFVNQSTIPHMYASSDCLVLPSDHGETWGLVVNEAMACGRPAIVSDQVGCAGDLIVPGETGDIFRFGDWDALAACMTTYANDRERLQQMRNNARAMVADYTPDAVADGICQAVRAVIANDSETQTAVDVPAVECAR